MKIFFALGGIGVVLGIIAKGIKPAIKAAIKWAISKEHPEVRAFVLEHREWIEAQFDAVDQAAKEAIEDEEAQEQQSAPPPESHQ